jgi:hypothetical protein
MNLCMAPPRTMDQFWSLGNAYHLRQRCHLYVAPAVQISRYQGQHVLQHCGTGDCQCLADVFMLCAVPVRSACPSRLSNERLCRQFRGIPSFVDGIGGAANDDS